MRVHSLTTRFLLALLFCTAIPFLAFGLYVRAEVRDREEQAVVNYLPQWADGAARKIATSLENAYRVGGILASDAETYLRENSRAFEVNVRGAYFVNEEFDMVVLADETGRVDMVTRNSVLDEQRQYELDALQPKSVANQDWFRRIASEQTGAQWVWVSRHTSPFLHRSVNRQTKDPNDYSMGLAMAVQMKNGKYGALFILLNWRHVQAIVDETCRFLRENAGYAGAQVFLLDTGGEVLAHSDRGQYGARLEAMSGIDTSGFVEGADGVRRGVGLASLPGGDQWGTGWRVGLHVPVDQLFAASREFGRWLLLLVPGIAVVLIGLGILSSRAIVRPVRKLSAATEKIAQGDLSTRVVPRGSDELADLGHAFNTMAEDLATKRDQLRAAERQSAWAEMARQIAHEIKNPLTPMRMGAQMLLRAHREEDPRWRDLSERLARNVVQQTEALDRIASDFRQFAGSPVHHRSLVLADKVLASVEELLASMVESSEVDLSFEPGAEDAMIQVDVQEMRRVFLNLIHNAMQACGESGAIRVRSIATAAAVEFRVVDDGPGIPDDTRPKLFDPYFTTKTSGTGLGLAICRRILEAHGGDIRLETSAPPHTVFVVVVPIASGDAAETQIAESAE